MNIKRSFNPDYLTDTGLWLSEALESMLMYAYILCISFAVVFALFELDWSLYMLYTFFVVQVVGYILSNLNCYFNGYKSSRLGQHVRRLRVRVTHRRSQ